MKVHPAPVIALTSSTCVRHLTRQGRLRPYGIAVVYRTPAWYPIATFLAAYDLPGRGPVYKWRDTGFVRGLL